MEVQEFIQNFADLFDDTDVSIFKLETSFVNWMSGLHWPHCL